jgi:hypothetical protein
VQNAVPNGGAEENEFNGCAIVTESSRKTFAESETGHFIFDEFIVICVEWLLLREECLSNFVGEENRESVKEKREASVYA